MVEAEVEVWHFFPRWRLLIPIVRIHMLVMFEFQPCSRDVPTPIKYTVKITSVLGKHIK
jgi:hypothetical protein